MAGRRACRTTTTPWTDCFAAPCVPPSIFKFVTVGIAIALLAGAVMLPVGSEFFPKDLRDQFAIEIWLPESSTIGQTDDVAKQVEEILRKLSPTTDAEGNTVQRIRAMRTMGRRWRFPLVPELGSRIEEAELCRDPRRDVQRAGHAGLGATSPRSGRKG